VNVGNQNTRKFHLTSVAAVAAVFVVFAAPINAAELVGRYKVEGSNAGGTNLYRGEAAVIQSGQTYQIAWKVGGQQFKGTGVLTGTTFSVVFQQTGTPASLVVYQLRDDGTLVGVWTGIGGTSLGSELMKPEGRL
jgi:hypothetical protein